MTTFGNLVSTNFGAAATATNAYGIPLFQPHYDALGNEYMFVEYDDGASVSTTPGDAVGYTTADESSTVTTDFNRSSSLRLCGVAMCSLSPTNKFGWILTRCNNLEANTTQTSAGAVLKLNTSSGVALNERLVWRADNVFEGVAASAISLSTMSAGIALTADSGTILDKAIIQFSFA